MPKGFTDHEKEWIKARLLEQGERLFAVYGLKKTNIEELAEAVGISKGAFYLFYASKEALFMDVVEGAEERFRQEVLAVIDLPGASPHARLLAAFDKAFTLWKMIPILRIFTRSDYDILARRVPGETIQEHLSNDLEFVRELVARCQQNGIPIRVPAEQINGLLHALFFVSLHAADFGPDGLSETQAILLDLVVAFCLGEIEPGGKSPTVLLPPVRGGELP